MTPRKRKKTKAHMMETNNKIIALWKAGLVATTDNSLVDLVRSRSHKTLT